MKKTVVALLITGLLFAVCTGLIAQAPAESTMGLIQRIFYIHVPCAMHFFILALIAGGTGLVFLLRRSRTQEAWFLTALDLALFFGLCVLITGPLWGRKAWGHWWVWDVRLTTTLMLWVTLVMARFVYTYGEAGGTRLAAGLGVFGMLNVPFVYLSVSFWNTIHPKATVIRSLEPGMRGPFWAMVATLGLFSLFLFVLRLRLALMEQQVAEKLLLMDQEREET